MSQKQSDFRKKLDKEEKTIKRIVQKIVSFEKRFPRYLIERACYRYKMANLKKRTAEKSIKELEKKLAEAKADLK
jgi:hypothetical protein